MSIGINNFTSQFRGGARASLFRGKQFFPGGAAGAVAGRRFEYQCKAVQIPSTTIERLDVMYQGRQIPVAGDRTFENLPVTVLNDIDFEIRSAYEEWSEIMNGHENNIGVVTPTEYYGTFVVESLGRDASVLAAYEFYNVFPTNVSSIDLNWESTNTIQEYTVDLAYTHWKRVA